MVDWELIRQQKKAQINKDNICENIKELTVAIKLNNNITCTYETPYKGPFVITQCCTNGTVAL